MWEAALDSKVNCPVSSLSTPGPQFPVEGTFRNGEHFSLHDPLISSRAVVDLGEKDGFFAFLEVLKYLLSQFSALAQCLSMTLLQGVRIFIS
ncbi:hypothetical protein CDAR_463561 [Caerostris darwini]|uniref:Uncharacterized protein n=1 Tax=Caerostris darwini TaxID=1538125 RepID=A0AAV4RP90_9ARAC|nr:hypothetical protein CDAR_463561 [Caerostris darwini]